jgi:hypothetical protein
LAVALISIAITAAANAAILGQVDIENHNNALSDIGQLFGGGLTGGFYYTGIYSWTNEGSTTNLAAHVPNWGFCIELTQGPYNGWQDVITLEDAPQSMPMETKANYIRELWKNNFNSSWLTGGTVDRQMGEAFGACLWEILYETGGAPATWDVTSGPGFHANYIEQAATANGWLRALTGTSNPAYLENNLYATSTPDGQDYLVQLPGLVTPEPATICILGFGALSFLRRKK